MPLAHTCSIRSLAFSHDGTAIVSGSVDRAIKVWDAGAGSPLPQSPYTQQQRTPTPTQTPIPTINCILNFTPHPFLNLTHPRLHWIAFSNPGAAV